MKKSVKELVIQKKQLILYLVFGTVTSICSLLACYLTLKFGVLLLHDEKGEPTALLDILGSTTQWIVGVVVAFLTNKRWVFTDAERGGGVAVRQFGIFAGARVATYFLEVVLNLALIALLERLHLHAPAFPLFGQQIALSARFWAKALSAMVIVITNYFISKLVVFRKKKSVESEKHEGQ